MAYQTGTYSSPSNLLGILRSFLATAGWTENEYDAINQELHVSKNGIFWNLKAYGVATDTWDYRVGGPVISIYGLGGYLSTGYDLGSAFDDQPGHSMIRSDTGDLNKIGHPLKCKGGGSYYLHSFTDSDDIFIAVQPTDGLDPKITMMAVGKLEPYGDLYMSSSIGYAFSPDIMLPTGFFSYANVSGYRCGHQGSVLVYALNPDTGVRFWANNSCYAGVIRPNSYQSPAGLPLVSIQNYYPSINYLDLFTNYGVAAIQSYLATPNDNSFRTGIPLWLRMHREENRGPASGYPAWPKNFLCCSIRDTSPLFEYAVGSDSWVSYPNYNSSGQPAHYILVKKEV